MDFAADPFGSLVAIAFGLVGSTAWFMALWQVFKGQSVGLKERWGGFGHGLGGWQVTPPFALALIGASAIGIALAVMQQLPDRRPIQDVDADGVVDRADQCPAAAEDLDGHWDNDGCPDPDNDGDGRLDVDDQCPADPEDVDGFEDVDGCPDPDNDRDSVPDERDACPNQAEDRDRFEDEDGCPDPDNDGDGVCDPGIDPVASKAACIVWTRDARDLVQRTPRPSADSEPGATTDREHAEAREPAGSADAPPTGPSDR